eukprot:Gb_31745 [translate_table: standard]
MCRYCTSVENEHVGGFLNLPSPRSSRVNRSFGEGKWSRILFITPISLVGFDTNRKVIRLHGQQAILEPVDSHQHLAQHMGRKPVVKLGRLRPYVLKYLLVAALICCCLIGEQWRVISDDDENKDDGEDINLGDNGDDEDPSQEELGDGRQVGHCSWVPCWMPIGSPDALLGNAQEDVADMRPNISLRHEAVVEELPKELLVEWIVALIPRRKRCGTKRGSKTSKLLEETLLKIVTKCVRRFTFLAGTFQVPWTTLYQSTTLERSHHSNILTVFISTTQEADPIPALEQTAPLPQIVDSIHHSICHFKAFNSDVKRHASALIKAQEEEIERLSMEAAECRTLYNARAAQLQAMKDQIDKLEQKLEQQSKASEEALQASQQDILNLQKCIDSTKIEAEEKINKYDKLQETLEYTKGVAQAAERRLDEAEKEKKELSSHNEWLEQRLSSN